MELQGSIESGGFDIVVDGEVIGVVEMRENKLLDISIEEIWRGKRDERDDAEVGYGTEAVRLVCEHVAAEGYNVLETGSIVSPAMSAIVSRKLGGELRESPSGDSLYGVIDLSDWE